MKILVTGATGNSGRLFVRELIKHKSKDEFVFIVRNEKQKDIIDNNNISSKIVFGDLNDLDFVTKCAFGCNMIVHIASIFYSNNIIDAAISNDIKKVILVHTTGIYSQFKLASEEYKNIEKEIEEKTSMYKIKTIILRPTMIYGNLNDLNVSKFIKYVDRFPIMPVVGDGSSYIQPVNFVDLGRAYYAVMESFDDLKQHEYILSGSTKISLLNFYKLIAKYLNKKRILFMCH